MNDAPLSCASCGHDIEKHHPGHDHSRGWPSHHGDHCHGAEANGGRPCICDGFTISRTPPATSKSPYRPGVR
jgi:hypothetical protein